MNDETPPHIQAENERMHLLTFLQLKKPGPLFRLAVIGVQGAFFTTFFLAYFVNPRICHRLVGYIEEEAVKTVSCKLRRASGLGKTDKTSRVDSSSLLFSPTSVHPHHRGDGRRGAPALQPHRPATHRHLLLEARCVVVASLATHRANRIDQGSQLLRY